MYLNYYSLTEHNKFRKSGGHAKRSTYCLRRLREETVQVMVSGTEAGS